MTPGEALQQVKYETALLRVSEGWAIRVGDLGEGGLLLRFTELTFAKELLYIIRATRAAALVLGTPNDLTIATEAVELTGLSTPKRLAAILVHRLGGKLSDYLEPRVVRQDPIADRNGIEESE